MIEQIIKKMVTDGIKNLDSLISRPWPELLPITVVSRYLYSHELFLSLLDIYSLARFKNGQRLWFACIDLIASCIKTNVRFFFYIFYYFISFHSYYYWDFYDQDDTKYDFELNYLNYFITREYFFSRINMMVKITLEKAFSIGKKIFSKKISLSNIFCISIFN